MVCMGLGTILYRKQGDIRHAPTRGYPSILEIRCAVVWSCIDRTSEMKDHKAEDNK